VGKVESEPPPNKGYGNSTTLPFDVTDADTAKMALLGLAETVAARLREANVKAGVMAVGIKDNGLRHVSHQCVLGEATNITWEIHKEACRLFDELWDGSPIRHLGIYTSRMREGEHERQIQLFEEMDYEKLSRVDQTMDGIRKRFGIDAVKRAVFLENPIDHMSGGISREKRKVDYDRLHID
jgi:DNA polymerase-4